MEQHALLSALGCDSCQGFYFARPMSAGDLQGLMGNPFAGQPVRPILAPAADL